MHLANWFAADNDTVSTYQFSLVQLMTVKRPDRLKQCHCLLRSCLVVHNFQ